MSGGKDNPLPVDDVLGPGGDVRQMDRDARAQQEPVQLRAISSENGNLDQAGSAGSHHLGLQNVVDLLRMIRGDLERLNAVLQQVLVDNHNASPSLIADTGSVGDRPGSGGHTGPGHPTREARS